MSTSPDERTAPPEEPVGAVLALFGDRAELARSYWRHLSTTAVTRGLIGPREVPRLWERHLLNCAAVCELLPPEVTVVDVGSGAGLPGLAVAIARPDVRVTLVEPLQRRVDWLHEVLADLELTNVAVVRGRAEELRGTIEGDLTMARAVAGLPVLAGWCLPLTKPGGKLLALKGRSAATELAEAEAALRRLGATQWRIEHCGATHLREPTTVVSVTAGPGTERSSTAATRGKSHRRRNRSDKRR